MSNRGVIANSLVLNKIDRLLQKTKKKLSLDSRKQANRFNSKINKLKELNTFIDLEKHLAELNILQNPVVQRQIEFLKERNEQLRERQQIERDREKEKVNIMHLMDQLEIELDLGSLEQFDDNLPKTKYSINLTPQERRLRGSNSAMLQNQINGNKLLFMVKAKTKNQKIKRNTFQDQLAEQIRDFQIHRDQKNDDNYQQVHFYEKIENDIKEQNFREMGGYEEITNSDTTLKYQAIQEYLEKQGISFNDKDKVPNKKFLENFRQQSTNLIFQAQKQSREKYQEIQQNAKPRVFSKFRKDQVQEVQPNEDQKLISKSEPVSPRSEHGNSGTLLPLIERGPRTSRKPEPVQSSKDLSLPKIEKRKSNAEKSSRNLVQRVSQVELQNLIKRLHVTEAFFQLENKPNKEVMEKMRDSLEDLGNKFQSGRLSIVADKSEINEFLRRIENLKKYRRSKRKS